MKTGKLNLIEACDKAAGIISEAREMETLYLRGLKCLGEGQLRNGVMNLATEAIRDEQLSEEVFVSNENMVSFLCGVWVQFLLVEVAGVGKDKLKLLARKAFEDDIETKCMH